MPTYCPFCEMTPKKDGVIIPPHRTDLRRRWQMAHLAMHVKNHDAPEIIEGDLTRV